jgi:hypothetical protein
MRKALALFLLAFPLLALAQSEPDYSQWNRLLKTYYDPARGFDYGSLKAKDAKALQTLRQQLGSVNVAALNRKQQLAYWINVYNINTVATIVESYPVASIRDLSTDPLIFTVFKKDRVPFQGRLISLDDVENEKIRESFHDPRIHFAINCAAKSCPPIRSEAYNGANVDAQLDDQVRRFVASHVRFERNGGNLTMRTTKIMDWFSKDFGDPAAFLRKYAPADKQKLIAAAKDIDLEYDDYDWSLNDWKR